MGDGMRIACGWLWLLLVFAHSAACTTQSTSETVSTCPYRTVNYITHSLPQQCHKSSWSSSTATQINESKDHTSNIVTSSPTSVADTTADVHVSSTASNIPVASTETPSSLSQSFEAAQATNSPSPVQEDPDSESALGNANFLSFEEWKKQQLAKLGQSMEHIGKKQAQSSDENRKRPTNIHTSLDSLGDDAEIDLNFGGFTAEKPDAPDPADFGRPIEEPSAEMADETDVAPNAKLRNRDAGTTCKERFNYASFDCAATVLKTNSQASGATSVLVEKNKDSYMLNECAAENKFIILELCDDIAVDTVVLANFEFFSSTFRTFRVSVSDRYPVKLDKWKVLGTYEARNTREIQAFLVENPLIWARYLRVEFLTHYGNEFYCPLSLVRVHGTTMMEDYKHDEEAVRAEEDEQEDENVLQVDAGEALAPDAVAEPLLEEEANKSSSGHEENMPQPTPDGTPTSEPAVPTITEEVYLPPADEYQTIPANRTLDVFNLAESTCAKEHGPTFSRDSVTFVTGSASHAITSTTSVHHTTNDPVVVSTSISSPSTPEQNATSKAETSSEGTNKNSASNLPRTTSTKSSQIDHSKPGSSTQPHPANPTIQESFFKSVQKRLQMLESNSSLSLQYIEEQSRILREAFSKVEQKQVAKTTTFLNYLNATVISELKDFRQQYDQIWQSTVIELETQREQYQREVLAMNSRLGILADEIIFQKRMSILQSILVLLCLALVLFSRGALNSYLELPIVQNVMARSPSWRTPLSPETPNGSLAAGRRYPSSQSKTSSGGLGHERNTSDDVHDESINPAIAYSPPTPTSQYDGSEGDRSDSEVEPISDPVPSFEAIERPRSSPGVLTRVGDSPTPSVKALDEDAVTRSILFQSLEGGATTSLSNGDDATRASPSLGIHEG